MEYEPIKFDAQSADGFVSIDREDIRPFVPMGVPIYLHLKRNEKYVSIKGPLDFFTPEELERLRGTPTFFLHPYSRELKPVRVIGKKISKLLNSKIQTAFSDGSKVDFSPVPFVASAAVLTYLDRLWVTEEGAGELQCDPLLMAICALEMGFIHDHAKLIALRDLGVDRYELTLLRAGWAVMVALHLGVSDFDVLKKIFEQALVCGLSDQWPQDEISSFTDEILRVAAESLQNTDQRLVRYSEIARLKGDMIARFSDRLEVIRQLRSDGRKTRVSKLSSEKGGFRSVG